MTLIVFANVILSNICIAVMVFSIRLFTLIDNEIAILEYTNYYPYRDGGRLGGKRS